MGEEKTVLVLGAGASVPYGFPTGANLRKMILNEFDLERQSRLMEEGADFAEAVERELQIIGQFPFNPEEIERFRDQFRRAQTLSIDAFIELWPDDFLKIGKYAIARCLAKCESMDDLLDGVANENSDPHLNHWYQVLWNALLDRRHRSIKKLTVLTFNYDRSIQTYFETAATAALGSDFSDDWRKSLHIIPLHGSFPTGEDYEFGDVPGNCLEKFAEGIKFPFELKKDLDPDWEFFEVPRNYIREATRVFVMGFGFDDVNTSRLFHGIDYSNKLIRITRKGLGEKLRSKARNAFKLERTIGEAALYRSDDGDESISGLISEVF